MTPPSSLIPHPSSASAVHVLIIDDEEPHAQAMAESLHRVGYQCTIATTGQEGLARIGDDSYDLIITDLVMEGAGGLEILKKAKAERPDTEVILISGHGTIKTAVAAMQQGAANYLTKPLDLQELRAVADKASQTQRLARSNIELQRQLNERFGFEGVVGNSPQMHRVLATLRQIAPTSATVLIQGESGTGKELVAKAIHNNSPRKPKPFVALNCAALSENLIESELFGHEKGAFTGADTRRVGRFEYASGGTLFLDEVGDMPHPTQIKLLRTIESGEVMRVGSNEPIRVSVRLLSATNRKLNEMVDQGDFRKDLYYRLKVVTVNLPPLRERREDIPLLVEHFLKELAAAHSKRILAISPPVRKLLMSLDWPGNVRQLRNVLEGMVVVDLDGVLDSDDLPDELSPTADSPAVDGSPGLVGKPLDEVERYYIQQALKLTSGNREEAAHLLGIGERTLYRKIKLYGLS